jgi:hypothetical protein
VLTQEQADMLEHARNARSSYAPPRLRAANATTAARLLEVPAQPIASTAEQSETIRRRDPTLAEIAEPPVE